MLIKASTDYTGRPEPTAATTEDTVNASKNPAGRSIFVGNLGFTVTEEELYAHFSPAGKIKKVRMTTFEDTGKCKGFAWIDYEEVKSAANVFAGKYADAGDPVVEEVDESGSDEEDGKAKKKRKVNGKKEKKEKNKVNPFAYMGSRKLRLEYGEDPTTRYKKRHGTEGKEGKEGGGSERAPRRNGPTETGLTRSGKSFGNENRPQRPERKEKKPVTAEEKQANAVESRLTGRIVEGTGKKVTFD